MRFIHTADWHLGNKMHDIDRTGEVNFFLSWLKTQIEKQKALSLIISGDIFDTANPPTESRTQFKNFLSSLLSTCCKNVVIIGGNHDSASLLDSDKELLNALNIHIVGSLSGLKPEELVFELKDEKKELIGLCCAVPFARETELKEYCSDETEDGTFCDTAFKALYKKVLICAQKKAQKNNIPIIATGHLYAADLEGRFESLKNEPSCDDGRRKLDVVGKLGSVHEKIFPKEFDYVALGHIHYTTMVCKNPKIRYSGSPFVMGFDEASIPRCVLCVDTEKNTTSVKKIEIPKYVNYRRINGDFYSIESCLRDLIDNPPKLTTYLELYYKKNDGASIYERLEDIINTLEEKNVFVVSRKVQETNGLSSAVFDDYDMEEMSNLDPVEIFKSYILYKLGTDIKDKTEEQIKADEKEILDTYLPIFTQNFNSFDQEEENENS